MERIKKTLAASSEIASASAANNRAAATGNTASDAARQERLSSAYSLSDMEIFIFPDLMYALVIANILSPELWAWKNDPWFANIEKKSFNYKLNRIKQYIMDHFVFNLDLDTWGLTTKETEINRFKGFVDMAALKVSNALFGYEGDKYYFDLDIRRHFGLDRYDDEQIPYWKTETIEAMKAFRYKEGYGTGAGECVSLAALYVAAMFVVGHIPLEKMFMIATPLHSQNFMAEGEGFMTNNRRIVTKKMWYNGTEISAKARRAVEHEKITIVSHVSGYIHTFYEKATIDPSAYDDFQKRFRAYLSAPLTFETFANFLFSREKYWDCFQYAHRHNGKTCYLPMRSVFNAQRSSKNRFDNESRVALLQEMEAQAFSLSRLPEKILINEVEDYLYLHPDGDFAQYERYFLKELLIGHCANVHQLFAELKAFLQVEPRLPEAAGKRFETEAAWTLAPGLTREAYRDYVYAQAADGVAWAELALYAYRDMLAVEWPPFLKAAVERNPVGLAMCGDLSDEAVYARLQALPSVSIYDEDFRLAQPDEVWNYGRGDGLEKAVAMLAVLKRRHPGTAYRLTVGPQAAVGPVAERTAVYVFPSQKKVGSRTFTV
ncbi:MAG: hypothetical protein K2O01_06010 [Bacteroidales bacterium]|nr:hypothetical protein [Bacteroidales bacterium]